jgi:hypothetical protein
MVGNGNTKAEPRYLESLRIFGGISFLEARTQRLEKSKFAGSNLSNVDVVAHAKFYSVTYVRFPGKTQADGNDGRSPYYQ